MVAFPLRHHRCSFTSAAVLPRIMHIAISAGVINFPSMKPGSSQLPSSSEELVDAIASSREAEVGINILRPLLWIGIFAGAVILWSFVGSLVFRDLFPAV